MEIRGEEDEGDATEKLLLEGEGGGGESRRSGAGKDLWPQ